MKLFFTELLTLDLIYSPRWISSKKDYDLARGLFFWGGGGLWKVLEKMKSNGAIRLSRFDAGCLKKSENWRKNRFFKDLAQPVIHITQQPGQIFRRKKNIFRCMQNFSSLFYLFWHLQCGPFARIFGKNSLLHSTLLNFII